MTARKLLILHMLLMACTMVQAQDGELLEYQQEIGGGLGITNYLGDANGGFMKHSGFYGTAIWRRNLNARMAIKTNLGMGHLSGNTEGTYIPQNANSETAAGGDAASTIFFSRNIVDLGAQFEMNFLGYGMGAAYKNLSRWTPYLLAGVGAVIAFGGGGETAGGLNVPLGLGFRYKLMPRLNIGLECSVNFTSCDKIDASDHTTQLNDPFGVKSEGLKNKDCYLKTLLFVTYDIAPKYRKCNN